MKPRQIATTLANFADIRRLGGVYIDKTKQIYDCMLGIDKYYFLARPRRFGKSLLCATLCELFLGNKELFKGLWIEQSDWQWETHPVIHLDMTFAAGEDNTIKKMEESIRISLNEHARKYGLLFSPAESIGTDFRNLVTQLSEKTGKGVVIIIDEYDKPILDLINKPEQRTIIHEALRSFYAPLKPLEKYIRSIFLTGVYKFTQTSIFSNLNNLLDLTFSPKAGTLVGYTQAEMKTYFSEEIDALSSELDINREQMLERLRIQYNGYHFGVNINTGQLSESVYNSYALNNVFASLQMEKKWFASGSPSFLIQKVKEGKFVNMENGPIQVEFEKLKNSCSPDSIDALSLFYYAGYATMHSCDKNAKIRLTYPNLEVSEATARELIALFRTNQSSVLFDLAMTIAEHIRSHQFNDLKELFNQALGQLTHQIIVQKEHYFQTVILLILQMGRLRADAEVPTNNGRMDIVITLPDEIIIIELKFNEPAANGLQQILDKDYAKKFRAQGKHITPIGLSVGLGKKAKQKSCVVDIALLPA